MGGMVRGVARVEVLANSGRKGVMRARILSCPSL